MGAQGNGCMSMTWTKRPAVPLAPALLVLIILFSVSFAEQVKGDCVLEEPPLYSCDLSSVCTSGYTCNPGTIGGTFNGLARCRAACVTERTGSPTPPPSPPRSGPIFDLTQALAWGAGIGIAIVALAFMAGQALNAQSIKAWARAEFGELIISAVLVALIIGIVSTSGQMGIVKALAPPSNTAFTPAAFNPPPSQTLTEAIEQRMQFAMVEPLQGIIESLSLSSMRLSKLLSYNYNYQAMVPVVNPTGSSSPAAGGMMLQMAMILGIDSGAINLLLASAVKLIYVFLTSASSLVLLPLGILLRFIPPTRQLGSLLLAIALSVLIVFPIAVLWSTHLLYDPAFANPIPPMPDPPSTSSGLLKNMICSPILSAVAIVGEDLIGQIVRWISCTGPQLLLPGAQELCLDPLPVTPLDPPIPVGTGLQHWVALYVWIGKFLAGGGSSLALYALAPTSQDVIDKAFVPLADNALPQAVSRNAAVLFMVVVDLLCSIVMAKNIAQVLASENQLYGLSRMV